MNCYFCYRPVAPWPCYETVLLQFREDAGPAFGTCRVRTVEEPAHRKCVELAAKWIPKEAA